MTTPDQLAAALQALQNTVLTLQTDLQAAQAESASARQEAAAAQAAASAAAAQGHTNGAGPVGERPFLDARALRGVDPFDGSQKAWRDWSVVTKNYAALLDKRMSRILREAELGAQSVANSNMVDDETRHASQKLFYLLVSSCRGPALDRVVNASDGEGALAWRYLVEKYEPRALTRQAGLLQQLLAWSFTGDVSERLEGWERELSRYEALSNETITDGIKIGVIIRQLDAGTLKDHLILNSERLRAYKDFRAEIVTVRLAFQTATGPVPMDLGAFHGKGGETRNGAQPFKGTCIFLR